jgi:dTDP-4-dehydrorhamnose reductase
VTTWHGFACAIVAAQAPLTGRKPHVIPITTTEFSTPARRPTNSELDCSLFEQTFSFRTRPWAEEAAEITQTVALAQQGRAAHVA